MNRPNTRNDNEFWVPMPKTTNYGSESVKYLGPKIWNILPKVLKESSTLYNFKEKIKSWIPYDCLQAMQNLYS